MATTLSRMMKKAASSSLNPLLANRRTPYRNYTSAIFTTPLKTSTTISNTGNSTTNLFRTTLIPTHHHFSAQATKIPKPHDDLFGYVYFTVNVSKNDEPTLEFGVIAEPDDKISFSYLKVKKPGYLTSKMESPSFWSSDEKLQKPFLKKFGSQRD